MTPNSNHQRVFPDSFQIILNQYLGKAEVKSLAPDGAPCDPGTKGLLRRAKIVARQLIPVGKETDRHWEQGEDPSMLDPKLTQKVIYSVLSGKGVRKQTMKMFRIGVGSLRA